MGRSLHCNHAGFNPRTHTGCDLHWYEAEYVGYVFQSTHPHGVRHTTIFIVSVNGSFNPRTHTGCDVPFMIKTIFLGGFNPRTHTRCDKPKTCANKIVGLFQSTHPHGVRLDLITDVRQKLQVSIHAPTRGATPHHLRHDGQPQVSIHAPTRGATRQAHAAHGQHLVSIHAPTRGATYARTRY